MPSYRIYPLDSLGKIAAPPHVVDCDDDGAALLVAQEVAVGRGPTEVWSGDRLIGRASVFSGWMMRHGHARGDCPIPVLPL